MQSILDIPPEKLTPGMRQYQDAKRENPDCIILLRMGDFYELFYEDAVTASKVLEITLTARGKGEKRAPLAGIPYHALDNYLGKFVTRGYKVAIVEQLEDPKKAKGLVKRGLVRIVTPGTVIESSILNEKENNYVMALMTHQNQCALALCDVSTGEFFTQFHNDSASLLSTISRFQPAECVIPTTLQVNTDLLEEIKKFGCFITPKDDSYFKADNSVSLLKNHFNIDSLEQFGIHERPLNIQVCGGLLSYLQETQKNALSHIKGISLQSNDSTMILDSSTFRNLELLKTEKGKTLLSVIDKTVTAMGARLLKKWIRQPLLQKEKITARLSAVEELNTQIILREELIEILKGIYDIERLIGRVNYGTANPKDILALRQSLECIPKIKEKDFSCTLLQSIGSMDDLAELTVLLTHSIREDAPLIVREGGIIKHSFHEELASLHEISRNAKQYIAHIEETEKQKTGISNLKVGYNRVFGYFIEVTKKNVSNVPDHYIRKQTTANAERYITEQLKVEEEKILGAQEKINELEYNLFQDILSSIAKHTSTLQDIAQKIAALDVVCTFSSIAAQYNYVKPQFVDESVIQIRNGRHVVVERMQDRFIPNDVVLADGQMMIITGPNTSGKSTIMRQTALIVLLAQMGSFVPADEAVLGIVDRIFTRVGASDDISSGHSTFMVEMLETSSILNNATSRSLVILDEIGRGTSTFDGVAIAWSVAEHIYNHIKAKTMFATHYHVLNKLDEKFERITNYNVAVKEQGGELVFLHKLVPGGTDQSHGVHVAKMAGLPSSVIERAQEIQNLLHKDDTMIKKINAKKLKEQMSLEGF